MESKQNTSNQKETINDAVKDVHQNQHQDLGKEDMGIEPQYQPAGDPDNPHRLRGFDDKRPESGEIKKGWTVDSNTSRNPEDLSTDPTDS